ncbi:Transcription factor WhiB (plasmid) [Mycobacterium intracellulare subsp. chimaera]|uniref:Transcription factor WhiB n=1 Tax=Mycobacterium intracellulare subsp. chimaera TaxID=222805 RepID=A0A7U5RY64_MYCIT|nr:Transcription factor WhiB [Mycobacterium intracellulare subsp. chimaera]ASL18268.1 Transcription factor WhiB [Mycobacterium intracellulare subsp. chimaera]
MTNLPPLPSETRSVARPFASLQLPADVRLFHTNQDLACRQDPELFFDARRRHRAIKRCAECPFLGRCGYNAVATGATHGVWGGVILPGDYPQDLKPVYAFLAAQFERRRHAEIGDIAVAPLPQPAEHTETHHQSPSFRAGAA